MARYRFKRMKEAAVKYGDGNWVLLKCIMDREVYDLLGQTPGFRGYRPESCIEVQLLLYVKPKMEFKPMSPITILVWRASYRYLVS